MYRTQGKAVKMSIATVTATRLHVKYKTKGKRRNKITHIKKQKMSLEFGLEGPYTVMHHQYY